MVGGTFYWNRYQGRCSNVRVVTFALVECLQSGIEAWTKGCEACNNNRTRQEFLTSTLHPPPGPVSQHYILELKQNWKSGWREIQFTLDCAIVRHQRTGRGIES
ncbi:hypothetical protein DMENIID0001_076620 [Sergentomyia squamirostris]